MKKTEIGVYMKKETFDHKLGKDTLTEGFDDYDQFKEWEFERLGESKALNKVSILWVASGGKWQCYFPISEIDWDIGPILRWNCSHFLPLPEALKTERKPFRGFTDDVPKHTIKLNSDPVVIEMHENILDFEDDYEWFDIEMFLDDFRWPKEIIIKAKDTIFIHEPDHDVEIDFVFFRGNQHIVKTGFGLEKKGDKISFHNGYDLVEPSERKLKKARRIKFQTWPLKDEIQ